MLDRSQRLTKYAVAAESSFQRDYGSSVRGSKAIALTCLFLMLFGISALAQSTTADVVGTVTDASMAVVPGAVITLTNQETHEKRKLESGGSGEFTFTLLKPGKYSLSISAPGFKSFEVSAFEVAAGDRAREDGHLTVGEQAETVTVSAEPPALHTDSSSLTSTVTEQATQELPLNGRNFINLVQITPGATEGSNNGLASGSRPDDRRQTSSVSVNGQSDVVNNQLIDGMDNNERSIGSIGVRPSVDAIQEVSVQSNVFSAEVGRAAGATVNVITKSGTNGLHGSVYEFFRNDVLNANAFQFGANIPKPTWRQNQFGGSLGGPILHDRTFFFADYEGFNLVREVNPVSTTVPTSYEQDHPGDFTDNPAINTRVTSFDHAGQQYFNLLPRPNVAGFSNNYIVTPKNSQFAKTGDARIDHRFSDRDLFYVRYTYNGVDTNIGTLFPSVTEDGLTISGGGNYSSFPGPATSRAHQAQLNYIHTFTPNLLLELKAGYTLLNNGQYPPNYGTRPNTAFGQAGLNVDARTSELSLVDVLQGTSLGGLPPIVYLENTYQYAGTLTWNKGKQSLKVGGGVIRRQTTITQVDAGDGLWIFVNFANLLAGNYYVAEQFETLRQPHNRTWEPHVFVQDDIHLTSKLTVNVGARYDIFTPYTEAHNVLSNFDTDEAKIVVAGQNGVSKYGNVQPDYSNFAPRAGFAYTVAPKTVVRGGFGLTFAPENLASAAALVNQPFTSSYGPVTQGTAPAGYTMFANGIPAAVPSSATNPTGSVNSALDPHFKSTYIEQFNLTTEREFSGYLASLSYVGELGHRVGYFLSDYNQATPNSLSYADPNDTTTPSPALSSFNYNTLRRFYAQQPNLTTIPYLTSQGTANYNALQAVLSRRFSKGLDLRVAYTLAHGLDDAVTTSANTNNGGFGAVASQVKTLEYGNSDLDVRHRITGTFVYQLPFGKHLHGVAGVLGKGWQANGLIIWSTGTPFSVTNVANRVGSDPGTSNTDRPNMVASPYVGHATVSDWFNTSAFQFQKVGTVGTEHRNQIYGPGLQRVDLSLFKNFALPKQAILQFRTEAFNVLNTAQFAAPNASLGGPSYGAITATANAYNPRVVQFAARISF